MTRPADLETLCLTLSLPCSSCSSPTPLNGPLRTIQCDECLRELVVDVKSLAEQLETSASGYRWLNGPFLKESQCTFTEPEVECATCGGLSPVRPHLSLIGECTSFPCRHCGAPQPTYPAPEWLRAELPAAVQIFGGERTGSDPSGVPVEVAKDSAEPVLMRCPGCGAGLSIGPNAERTTRCEYCGANVFIPDALWKRLHPVKKMQRWIVVYEGVLQTTETIAKERAEQEHRRQQEIDAEARREEHAERLEKQAEQRRQHIILFALLILVAAALPFILMLVLQSP